MQTAEGVQKEVENDFFKRGLWRDGMKKGDNLAVLLQQDNFDPTKLGIILDEIDFYP